MEIVIKKNRIYMFVLLKYFYLRLYKNVVIDNGFYFFEFIVKGLVNLSLLLRLLILNDLVRLLLYINNFGIDILKLLIDKNRKYWMFFVNFNEFDNFFLLNIIMNNFLMLFFRNELFRFILDGGNIVVLEYIVKFCF